MEEGVAVYVGLGGEVGVGGEGGEDGVGAGVDEVEEEVDCWGWDCAGHGGAVGFVLWKWMLMMADSEALLYLLSRCLKPRITDRWLACNWIAVLEREMGGGSIGKRICIRDPNRERQRDKFGVESFQLRHTCFSLATTATDALDSLIHWRSNHTRTNQTHS